MKTSLRGGNAGSFSFTQCENVGVFFNLIITLQVLPLNTNPENFIITYVGQNNKPRGSDMYPWLRWTGI